KWAKRRPAVALSLIFVFLSMSVTLAFAYRGYLSEQKRLSEQEYARLQLLDEKISNAYQIASSGDLLRTDKAIKEVEELGGSTGQVRLLRGIVAYFRSDTGTAISELEQAVKLLPTSVAARALLAMSYNDDGQFTPCNEMLEEMHNLTASSAEDYLFKGYARE